jgi:hypothetical protein
MMGKKNPLAAAPPSTACKKRKAQVPCGCLDRELFLACAEAGVSRFEFKITAQPGGGAGYERFLGPGGFRTQPMIEMADNQFVKTRSMQSMKESHGIRSTRYSNQIAATFRVSLQR